MLPSVMPKTSKTSKRSSKIRQLRFGTLNLQNLQLPGESMYHGQQLDSKVYDAKVDWLARMVKRMDVHFMTVQELWSPQCLHDVLEAAGLRDEYSVATELSVPAVGSRISVALVARNEVKIAKKKWVVDFPKEVQLKKRKPSGEGNEIDYQMSVEIDRFSRPVLVAKLELDGRIPIHVYGAHLKSKLPIRLDAEENERVAVRRHATALGSALATIRRTAEAAAVRVMVCNQLEKHPDEAVVVMGDLNDTTYSTTTAIITGQPKFRLFAAAGTRDNKLGLYSVGLMQDLASFRDTAYTYVHNGERESLDHMMVSQHLYDYSRRRSWSFRRMEVYNDHLDERLRTENKRTAEARLQRSTLSDHAGIVGVFDYARAR